MTDVNSILNQRMKKPSHVSKMAAMAKQSAAGNLTSFSGVFNISELSAKEKEMLANILHNYAIEEQNIPSDLEKLYSLTSEVKAINNQAALLHGERIKKVHQMLIHYREGAFTAWLIAAYGNRQTPYNLMQYYDFFQAMPQQLRPQIELMPRQAVYVLASRNGNIEKKQEIVESYKGETKAQMLALIRQAFPLEQEDKRRQNSGDTFIHELQRLCHQLKLAQPKLNSAQKNQARLLLQTALQLVGR